MRAEGSSTRTLFGLFLLLFLLLFASAMLLASGLARLLLQFLFLLALLAAALLFNTLALIHILLLGLGGLPRHRVLDGLVVMLCVFVGGVAVQQPGQEEGRKEGGQSPLVQSPSPLESELPFITATVPATHPPTHSPTHSLTHSLTHSANLSLTSCRPVRRRCRPP